MPRATEIVATTFVMPEDAPEVEGRAPPRQDRTFEVGGGQHRHARPRVDHGPSTRFEMRMPAEVNAAIERDAKRLGLSRAKWMLMAACMALESRGVIAAPSEELTLPDALDRTMKRYKRYAPGTHKTSRWDRKKEPQT